ncbi:Hypothetical predicted protein, partial [Paramuricea clavata]
MFGKSCSLKKTLPCACVTCEKRCWESKSWLCRVIECFCEERVEVCVERVSDESNEFYVDYVCADRSCGFKINAFDENFLIYTRVVQNVKDYMFFHERNMCTCKRLVRAVVERVT